MNATDTIIQFHVGPERIRQIGSARAGAQMTTPEAEAFFTLYKEQIVTQLEETVKRFVRSKLQV